MVPYSHAQMQTVCHSLFQPMPTDISVSCLLVLWLLAHLGIVAGFHHLYSDISVLATIRALHSDVVSSYLAGVLVRQKNSNTNLVSWSDLNDATKTAGKKLCSLATDSFSGFQIQQLESMLRTGKRLQDIFTGGITRCSSHDEVLETSRTAAVSGLRFPIDTWAIIGEEIAGQGNSTRPYPEWGVIALPHLSAELASRTHVCAPGRERDNTKLLKPCKDCDAGRYSVDGIGACRPCSPGFANALTGQTQYQRCPEGQVTYNFGELQCQPEQDRLLNDPIEGCSNYVNNTLTVGVQQAELSASFTINRWKKR
eukprot:g8680.t1